MRKPFQASGDHTDPALSAAVERGTGWLASFGTLHPAVMQGSVTIGINERLLLLGPVTTPTDVTVRVEGIMRTL